MLDYVLLKLVHLLLFAYWVGACIGIWHAARLVQDPSQLPAARQLAIRIMDWTEQLPKYCLVLMLPVGYTLARELGLVRLPAGGMWLLWVISLGWLGLVWAVNRYQTTTLGERLRNVDAGWRVVLSFGLTWDAVQGLRGTGHILVDWLSIKFALFALMIICSMMMTSATKRIQPALREVLASGSTPELEADIARSFRRAFPFQLAVWGLLICTAALSILKP